MFTFAEAYIVSFIASQYDPVIVLEAAFMTATLVVALTIYAYQTKVDFTLMGEFLLCICVAMCMAGIFLMIFENDFLTISYCALGVVLFGIFLIFDT